jgi:hypothetical protein
MSERRERIDRVGVVVSHAGTERRIVDARSAAEVRA